MSEQVQTQGWTDDMWIAAEAVAQALADGHGGCTGGCAGRPCEVDRRDAETIMQRIADAMTEARQGRVR